MAPPIIATKCWPLFIIGGYQPPQTLEGGDCTPRRQVSSEQSEWECDARGQFPGLETGRVDESFTSRRAEATASLTTTSLRLWSVIAS